MLSEGVITMLKLIGSAVIIVAIVLAIIAIIALFFPELFTWFKGKVGMNMIVPLAQNTLFYTKALLWG